MTEAEINRKMRGVLLDAIAHDMQSISDPVIEFEPSQRHERQIRQMLKDPLHWMKSRNRGTFQIIAQWVAVIVLFISLSFGFVMLFNSTARAAFERWIVEWYQTHIIYRYSGRAENLPRYGLSGLPEGYSELERMEEPTFVYVLYGNESGELISFSYEIMVQGGAAVFVPNGDTVSKVMIGKNQGRLFIPQDPESLTTLTWIDDEAEVQFVITADLDEPDMIRLAKSLRREKKK